jgi:hypothetical protein
MDVLMQYLLLFESLDSNITIFLRDHTQDKENHQQRLSNSYNYLKKLHSQIIVLVLYKNYKFPNHHLKKQLLDLKSVHLIDGIKDDKLPEDQEQVFELRK